MSSDSEFKILSQEANQALRDKDYDRAKSIYETLANNGSKTALLMLARINEHGGEGVVPDINVALYFYERAFKEGDLVEAGLALGRLYYLGAKIPKDHQKAFFYYSKFESSENIVGLLRLGTMYELGQGTKKDLKKAILLYGRAAKLGSIFARKNLGVLKIREGYFASGYFLWITAIIFSIPLFIFNQNDRRLRTF